MKSPGSRAGFSLVEVALALMVVGVGMVAVFSVLPVGLDANKKAIDDAQTAMFAEEVFNGFRAQAQLVPWSQVPTISLPNPVKDMWVDGAPLTVTPGVTRTNIYDSKLQPGIVDYAIRYQLRTLNIPGQTDVLGLRLLVWNGEFGGTANISNPAVFYTEIRRSRL